MIPFRESGIGQKRRLTLRAFTALLIAQTDKVEVGGHRAEGADVAKLIVLAMRNGSCEAEDQG